MTDREAFTARVLSALMTELTDAKENPQRIEASIITAATGHGVKMSEQPIRLFRDCNLLTKTAQLRKLELGDLPMVVIETIDQWTSQYIEKQSASLSSLLGATNPDKRLVSIRQANIASAKRHRLAVGLSDYQP